MILKILPGNFYRWLNTFSKVAGYKIYIPKSAAFLNTKDKQMEKETRETILLAAAKKKKKNLGISLTKKVKASYNETFERMNKFLKKIPEDGAPSHAHRSVGLIVWKMTVLLKAV